jgi:hypothetical protein
MTEKITLELTLNELKTIDKYVVLNDETKPLFEKIKSVYPKPKMIVENQGDFEIVSYNDSIYYYLHYPTGSHWFLKNDGNLEHITDKETIRLLDDAWFKDYNEVVELAKPAEEVFDRLEDKYKKAEENSASYITNEVVNSLIEEWKENPPDFLKFELGKTLEELIADWWWDVHGGINSHWSVDSCVADLCKRVGEWLPVEQNSEGTQRIETEIAVDTHNELLQKIKSKLRNKN